MTQIHYGYWIFGRDMLDVDLETLKKNGTTDLFLNYYAFTTHGETKTKNWIKQAASKNINIHIWMQCFYDGEWINPVTQSSIIKKKIAEAQKYSKITGVAGIHLDYLRYPGNAYKTEGAADAITNFVKQVRNKIPTNTLLTCATMPETDNKYYYGQDITALGKIVDAILPMQYKGNYEAGTTWLAETTKTLSKKATIWSGLQTYKSDEDPTQLTTTELQKDIKTCLQNGAKGTILFRYGLTPKIQFTTTKPITQKIAQTVITTVQNKQKIPNTIQEIPYPTYTYMLAKKITNPTKTIKTPTTTIKPAPNPQGTKINNHKIDKIDYINLAKKITTFIEKNHKLPNYIIHQQHKLRTKVYIEALARIVNYYHTHNNTLPNYVTINTNIFNKKWIINYIYRKK